MRAPWPIHVFDDLDQVAEATCPLLGQGRIALSGGSTFSLLFQRWIDRGAGCTTASFFPVDERMVDFEDPQSNWGTAYRLFLSKIGRSDNRDHHPQSLRQFLQILQREFGDRIPLFDSIFLGVGTDGHTASLFPGTDALNNDSLTVLETESPLPPRQRLTLGRAVLSRARRLIVIVYGNGKERAAKAILGNDLSCPVVKVMQDHSAPEIWIDAAVISAQSECTGVSC